MLRPGQIIRARDSGVEFNCELVARIGSSSLWAVHVHGAESRIALGTYYCATERDSVIRERFRSSRTGWFIMECDIIVDSKGRLSRRNTG